MAGGAVLGCRLIEEYSLGGHCLRQFVAVGAAHILMGTPQRELGPLVVVERRRFPLAAVVALGAVGDVCLRKLLAMDVLMAILALSRSSLEIHVEQPGFKVRRLVAIDAGSRAMRPEQREFRLGVVKAREFFPRLGGVAGLAPGA